MLDLVNLEERLENNMKLIETNMDEMMGHIDKNMERIANLIKTQRGIFQKVVMWPKVLKEIKIVFMLRNPLCILQDYLILIMKLIRGGP